MQKVRTLQRRNGPGLVALGIRRLLVLLVVSAFALSGLAHIAGGNQTVAEAATVHSHEFLLTVNSGGGDPCCLEHTGQPHASACSMASGCSLCVPVAGSAAAIPQPEALSKKVQPDDGHVGRAPSPQFRPPKLSVNA